MADLQPQSAIDRREMQLRQNQAASGKDLPSPMETTRPTALPVGKYPKDFTKLYNDFVKGYAQRPGDVAKERQAGGGPWTDRMDKLDDIKGTLDWVRGEGKPLAQLPLAAQDYVRTSPDYHEWQAQQPPMGRQGNEALQPPDPRMGDIRRLFQEQILRNAPTSQSESSWRGMLPLLKLPGASLKGGEDI